ncbi:AGAP008656-PA-like protein [Anopheles sinensis]|uniref:AGAP008656-PA-like protein n=1 Tax=Anopheles sinensis TaxID=74873 RepID=A0A084WQQ7_ANOSI|nr:AGAP008656-PA-like protein [Anopheles sinensis]
MGDKGGNARRAGGALNVMQPLGPSAAREPFDRRRTFRFVCIRRGFSKADKEYLRFQGNESTSDYFKLVLRDPNSNNLLVGAR